MKTSVGDVSLLAILLLCDACDPIRSIVVSRSIDRVPERQCVMGVLRSSALVRNVGQSSSGVVFGQLAVPPNVAIPWHPTPEAPTRFAVVQPQQDGTREYLFRITWVAGFDASKEYRQFAAGALRQLQAAVLDQCGAEQSQALDAREDGHK